MKEYYYKDRHQSVTDAGDQSIKQGCRTCIWKRAYRVNKMFVNIKCIHPHRMWPTPLFTPCRYYKKLAARLMHTWRGLNIPEGK